MRTSSTGSSGPVTPGARAEDPVRRALATPTTTSSPIAMTSTSVVQFSHEGLTVSGTATGAVSGCPSVFVTTVVRVTVPLAMASTSTAASAWPRAGTSITVGSPTWTRGLSEVTSIRTVIGESRPLLTVIGTFTWSEMTL